MLSKKYRSSCEMALIFTFKDEIPFGKITSLQMSSKKLDKKALDKPHCLN